MIPQINCAPVAALGIGGGLVINTDTVPLDDNNQIPIDDNAKAPID